MSLNDYFKDKVILIVGGTGSWGTELTSQLLLLSVKCIRIYSRGEHRQIEMQRRFNNEPRLQFYIGCVRDRHRLFEVCKGVDIIFHFAALKHVPICERDPYEAVQTNISGTQNVIDAAISLSVKTVVFASSDKGVDPISMYGITKACAERLIVSANFLDTETRFMVVRAGNVFGSRGSVVPLFKLQIKETNSVLLTHRDMTRFFIGLPTLIEFVIERTVTCRGGEVFIPKMRACCIEQLAVIMVDLFGNEKTTVNCSQIRPGEKMHELLISRYEIGRAFEEDTYFLITPMLKDSKDFLNKFDIPKPISTKYSSQTAPRLDRFQITEMMEISVEDPFDHP